MLMLIPIAMAIEDCQRVMTPNDVPCIIISPWEYDTCSATEIGIYNSTPSLIQTGNFSDYGTTEFCYTTWNISTKGSYFINVSNGDILNILIQSEEDVMASLSVILFFGAITAAIFYIGFTDKRFSANDLLDFILKKSALLLALFLTSLNVAILATIADNAGLGISQEIFRYLWIVNWTIYLSMFTIFVITILKSLEQWRIQAQKKKYGEE